MWLKEWVPYQTSWTAVGIYIGITLVLAVWFESLGAGAAVRDEYLRYVPPPFRYAFEFQIAICSVALSVVLLSAIVRQRIIVKQPLYPGSTKQRIVGARVSEAWSRATAAFLCGSLAVAGLALMSSFLLVSLLNEAVNSKAIAQAWILLGFPILLSFLLMWVGLWWAAKYTFMLVRSAFSDVYDPGSVSTVEVPGSSIQVPRPTRSRLVSLALVLTLGLVGIASFAILGRGEASPSATGYELARVRGVPVRWDPCDGPIRVAVNYGNLTPVYRQRALDAMQYGLARMSEETGLDFVLTGESDRTPDPRSSGSRRTNADAVVVGFLPAGTALMAGVRDDVAVRLSTLEVDDSAEWRVISAADVHVRSKVPSYQVAVLEGLARASGLHPVSKSAGPGVLARNPQGSDFGEGDRAGLEAVGASRGCLQ